METASRFGIREDRAVNYHADRRGTVFAFGSMSDALSNIRSRTTMRSDWREKLDEDFSSRSGSE